MAVEWDDATGANGPGGLALLFGLNPAVSDDPCRPADAQAGEVSPPGLGIDGLVASLSSLEGASVSNTTNVVLDSYPGMRVDLQLPATPSCAEYRPFDEPNGVHAQGASNRWRIWFLDINGQTGFVAIMDYEDTPTDRRAAAEAVVDSMRILRSSPTMRNGEMDPGIYVAHPEADFGLAWAFTVPGGWTGIRDWALYPTDLGLAGTGSAEPDGLGIGFINAPEIVLDPCGATLSETGSVAELVAAIRAKDDWVVSAPVDVVIDGFSGQRIDVELPADLAGCANGYHVFRQPQGEAGYDAQGPSNRLRLWILDVDGGTVLLLREAFAATPADRLAEADRIVESSMLTP